MKGRSNRAAVAPDPQDQGTNPNTPLAHPANALQLQSPRLLTKQEAANYCGVTPDTFDDYRRRAIVPDPIQGTNRWDKKLIDLWLDKASGIASQTNSSLEEWRARRDG